MIIKLLITIVWIIFFSLTLYYQMLLFRHIKSPNMSKTKILMLGPFVNRNYFDDEGKVYCTKFQIFGAINFILIIIVIKIIVDLL